MARINNRRIWGRQAAMSDKKANRKKNKGNAPELAGEVLSDARETAAVEAHWRGLDHGHLPEKPVKKYK
jgi:hypothetical protein